jgi:hypothetical protein
MITRNEEVDSEEFGQFLHEVQGQLPPFACPLDLFVIQLLDGMFHQLMVRQTPACHQGIERLRSVIAGCVWHRGRTIPSGVGSNPLVGAWWTSHRRDGSSSVISGNGKAPGISHRSFWFDPEITVSARHGPLSGCRTADQYQAATSVHVDESCMLVMRS